MTLNISTLVSDDVARTNKVYTITREGVSKRLRRLKWHELVSPGDYVMNGINGFESWDGPTGFQANAFVKPIYRHDKARASTLKEQG